jgi:AraC-like DNA-binding protein
LQESQDVFFSPPRALIHAIRESLKPYLHLPNLSVDKAAEICGFKERVLRRKLHDVGTSLSGKIAALREKKKTIQLLLGTDKSIADIGDSVGFGDAASFTRSFKKWTGMSPREYRQSHRAGSGQGSA